MSALKKDDRPPGARGRRERNKADKLERIEESARSLFAELGYDATTTRAIAERADIAVGTLFTYFPEKRGLLVHLVRADVDRAIERAFETMPAVPPADPVDALTHLFRRIYRVYERDRGLARVFVKEALFVEGPLGVDLGVWTGAFIARLGSLLATWREEGALGSQLEPMTAAYQVFAQYYFGLVAWLGTSAFSAATRDHVFAASLEQLVRGIGKESER